MHMFSIVYINREKASLFSVSSCETALCSCKLEMKFMQMYCRLHWSPLILPDALNSEASHLDLKPRWERQMLRFAFITCCDSRQERDSPCRISIQMYGEAWRRHIFQISILSCFSMNKKTDLFRNTYTENNKLFHMSPVEYINSIFGMHRF